MQFLFDQKRKIKFAKKCFLFLRFIKIRITEMANSGVSFWLCPEFGREVKLNNKFIVILSIVAMSVCAGNARSQNFIFKYPRTGGFKVKDRDKFDFSNAQHYTGSGILAVGFYKLLADTPIKHEKLVAGLAACLVGLAKEIEDGYREGFGEKDLLFNQLGIISFLFLSELTHYTLTLKYIVGGDQDYGLGLRFFRTNDFSPLKISLGLYAIRDVNGKSWVGMDSHFNLHKNAEIHMGASAVDINDANAFHFRPNIGLAFRFL